MKEKLLKIIQHYGAANQRKKLCEEFMELQDELANVVNGKPENILTELADVIALTLQFMTISGYSFDLLEKNLKDEINFKIQRQLDRISEEE
jgi:NTP pyrophosphatase (non-canonical NTP hydrolase)